MKSLALKNLNILNSILIIDDDQGMQNLVSNYVKTVGAEQIDIASSGSEGLERVLLSAYDLVIVDWKAKGPTGPQLYAALRSNPLNPGIFIVFISGQITRADINHTAGDPGAKFIVKPFTQEILIKVIEDLYQGRLKPQIETTKNFYIEKGEGHRRGHDLSIHKTDRSSPSGSSLEKGKTLNNFSIRVERPDLPSGQDLRIKKQKNDGSFEISASSTSKLDDDIELSVREENGRYLEIEEKRPPLNTNNQDFKFQEPVAQGFVKEEERSNSPGKGHDLKLREPLTQGFAIEQKRAKSKATGTDLHYQEGRNEAPSYHEGKANSDRKGIAIEVGNKARFQNAPAGPSSSDSKLSADFNHKRPADHPSEIDLSLEDSKAREFSIADETVDEGGKETANKTKADQGNQFELRSGEAKGIRPGSLGDPSEVSASLGKAPLIEPLPMLSDLDSGADSHAGTPLTHEGRNFEPDEKRAILPGADLNYKIESKIKALQRQELPQSINVLVIDEDLSLTNLIQNHLAAVKIDMYDVYHDGTEAWEAVQKYHYDLIIMDWRSKGLSGLCLFNRLRARAQTRKTPIIIMSGSIAKENFRIIEDKNSTIILEKPFAMRVFEQAVEKLRHANRSDHKVIELACTVVDQNLVEKSQMLIQLGQVAAKIAFRFEFLLAAGQYLMHLKEFQLALKVLEAASKLESRNVMLMTELAKVYLRLDKPTESLRLLIEADRFSPRNIERLCLMGEAGLDLYQTEKARDFFQEVLAIDQEHAKAKTGVLIASNLGEYLENNGGNPPLGEKFASVLNLIGVAFIKNKKTEKGIEQYHAALAFIHDVPTTARIEFNLGLAYFRTGDKKMATDWLESSVRKSDKNFTKAQIWLNKIQTMNLQKPEKMIMNGSEAEVEWDTEEFVDLLADSLSKFTED